jgi:hypothetical protein
MNGPAPRIVRWDEFIAGKEKTMMKKTLLFTALLAAGMTLTAHAQTK